MSQRQLICMSGFRISPSLPWRASCMRKKARERKGVDNRADALNDGLKQAHVRCTPSYCRWAFKRKAVTVTEVQKGTMKPASHFASGSVDIQTPRLLIRTRFSYCHARRLYVFYAEIIPFPAPRPGSTLLPSQEDTDIVSISPISSRYFMNTVNDW